MPESKAERTQFSTGAVRGADVAGSHGKHPARYDLITPVGLRRLAETYGEGAEKYTDNNWQKGIPAKNLINHALAHITQWLAGDTSEDHLAHAVWNLFSIMHFEETRPELIDVDARKVAAATALHTYLTGDLILLVEAEAHRGDRLHGEMTPDIFRAMSILGEEQGESCEAALEVRRGNAPVKHAVEELVQVMAVSARIVKNLIDGRVEWWGREDTRKERAKDTETAKVAGPGEYEGAAPEATGRTQTGSAASTLPGTFRCEDGISGATDDGFLKGTTYVVVCQGRTTCR